MTRQTYREMMNALQVENEALRKEIAELKRQQPNIYDNRSLDEILDGYREDGRAEAPAPISFQINKKDKSVKKELSGFIDRYREYRRMVKEENALYDNEIVMDVSALDELRNSVLCEKPA